MDLLRRVLGKSYILVLVPTVGIGSAAILVVIVVLVSNRSFLGLPWDGVRHVLWTSLITLEAAVVVIIGALLLSARSIIRWTFGQRTAIVADSAWREAVRLPSLFIKLAVFILPVGAAPAMAAFNTVAHPPAYITATVCGGVALIAGLGIALNSAAIDASLRPVLTEIVTEFPEAAAAVPAEQMSLRRRIVIPGLLIVFCSAYLTTGLTGRTTDPRVRIALTIGAAALVAASFGLILTLALSQAWFVLSVSSCRPQGRCGPAT